MRTSPISTIDIATGEEAAVAWKPRDSSDEISCGSLTRGDDGGRLPGLAPASALAQGPDGDLIAKVTGRAAEVQGGVVKITLPRTDLSVRADGVALVPFQGLTSWAAFQSAGPQTMVMGDVVVTESEATPALTAALDSGLEVTALHNHFTFEQPRVLFMHIGGLGTTESVAAGVRAVLDAVATAGKGSASGATGGFAGPTVVGPSHIDAKPLEEILGASAQVKDGMAKFVFGRTARMHGTDVGAAMGVNTWAVFAGGDDAAVVDGDFAMREDELQSVLKALRRGGLQIVAIHNHMTHEDPRYVFLHYWGKGSAQELARTIRSALDTQSR
jgi:hypothetical protein